ncbi:MAG: AraC family transcriptional regulator, partial [Alistipes sp.]|nr:AraC family transcriptional regulator [Alistipes sp.]
RHSIADICMLVGFNSPSYFSSCFKKQYGCLPKDYK